MDQRRTNAVHYIRRLVSGDPVVPLDGAGVVNVDVFDVTSDATTMCLDLDDGTTIRLDVRRYDRDPREVVVTPAHDRGAASSD